MHGVCGTLGLRDTLRGHRNSSVRSSSVLGISGRVCGDTGFAADTETRVCSQSSGLGISERGSVVRVDVVSINTD